MVKNTHLNLLKPKVIKVLVLSDQHSKTQIYICIYNHLYNKENHQIQTDNLEDGTRTYIFA